MTDASLIYKDRNKIFLNAIKFPDVNRIYVVLDVAQWAMCINGNGN